MKSLRVTREHKLWPNLNRLAVIASALLLLKLFTFFFQEFLPIFGEVLGKLITAFLPFLIALIIAFLLEPLVRRLMSSWRLPRAYAAVLTLILTMAVLGLFVFVIVARLYTELSELAVTMPNYNYIVDFVSKQIDTVEKFANVNPQVQNAIFSSTQSLLNSVQDWAKAASVVILSFLAALPGVFIVLVVSIVATLLVSSSYPNVKSFAQGFFPQRWYNSAHVISRDLGAASVGFLRAEAILVSITAVTTIIGLLILGNRYAVTLGVLAGILDLVPIVGTGLLFVPWIISLFIIGSLTEGIKLLLIWVLTVVIRQFLEPKILSHNIGLHPLPTLISMYVGLKLLGGAGLILGPTIVIIYQALRKAGIIHKP